MRRDEAPTSRPASIPADAVGFISRRKDRPERLAAFMADGRLSNTFAFDETLDDIRAKMARIALIVDDAGIIRYDGDVAR